MSVMLPLILKQLLILGFPAHNAKIMLLLNQLWKESRSAEQNKAYSVVNKINHCTKRILW